MSEPVFCDVRAMSSEEIALQDAYYERLYELLMEVTSRLGIRESGSEHMGSCISVATNDKASPKYDLAEIFEAVLDRIPSVDNIKEAEPHK